MHGAVVGNCKRVLAQPFGFGHHVLDAPQAIEQRVFSVYVQMDKIAGHKFTIIQESNADAE